MLHQNAGIRMTQAKLKEFLERGATMDDAELSTFRMRVSISDLKKDVRNKLYDAIEKRALLIRTVRETGIDYGEIELEYEED